MGVWSVSQGYWAWYIPNGTLHFALAGAWTAVSFTSTSDARLKDNIIEATTQEAAAILDAVKVKTYTRNDRKNEPRVGFVAQDLPGCVHR